MGSSNVQQGQRTFRVPSPSPRDGRPTTWSIRPWIRSSWPSVAPRERSKKLFHLDVPRNIEAVEAAGAGGGIGSHRGDQDQFADFQIGQRLVSADDVAGVARRAGDDAGAMWAVLGILDQQREFG